MTDFVLKALSFGVLGLCAVMLVIIARVLVNEQKRDGEPRTGLIRALYAFLVFCFGLAVLNAVVQLWPAPKPDPDLQAQKDRVVRLEEQLRLANSKLDEVELALGDKEYTELQSLAATTDPATRQRLERTIKGLKSRIADLRTALKTEPSAEPKPPQP